jgi:hypothetical protein
MKMMQGRDSSDTSPIKRSPTLVDNRIQYSPNYDAKRQTGMESAEMRVGMKMKPQTNRR